jgi:hypothetical protein
MRKLVLAAVALVAALALGGTALAVNQYTVDVFGASPSGAGSAEKPRPVKLNFGFEVEDDQGLRPAVISEYRVGAEGLVTYPEAFPTCTFAQVSQGSADLPRACDRAIVGGCTGASCGRVGLIKNHAGAAADRTQKLICNLRLRLVNISSGSSAATTRAIRRNGGLAIRVDGDPPAAAPDRNDVGCAIPLHTAIAAPYYPVRVGGQKSDELRFTVPDNLAHPGTGLDNSLIDVVARVSKETAKKKIKGVRRTVGFYSSVGCKGRRTIRVRFDAETGGLTTATRNGSC